MAIPDFQSVMLPLVEALADGKERTIRELTNLLADQFRLTQEEREEVVPSGQKTRFYSRVSWANFGLKQAGLIQAPARGRVRITDLGKSVLQEKPQAINDKYLMRFPGFVELKSKPKSGGSSLETPTDVEEERTPFELIDAAYQLLSRATVEEVLTRLRECSPGFFEKVMVNLLMAMGYGGVAGQGVVTGRSGDGGIDGVIWQDKLGLDVVCIQAKRWEGPVGRPVVQGFVGSMDFHRAKKGVVMTTSTFTKEALDFVHRIEGKKVVLIDGGRLAELMIEHDLGVTTTKVYKLKEVSNDFFDESEG